MREVGAGLEDAPARVLGMVDHAPSQDADLEVRVEQHKVDGGLERRDGGIVFGVQVAQVAQLDHAGLALPGGVGHTQVGLAARAEAQPSRSTAAGVGRRIAWMRWAPARGVIEDLRQEDALIQLDARVLVHLGVAPLGQDRGPGAAPGRDSGRPRHSTARRRGGPRSKSPVSSA